MSSIDFDVGTIAMTAGVHALIKKGVLLDFMLHHLLARHQNGDWGEVCVEDAVMNDEATVDGGRILSSYTIDENIPDIWIITEADRSVTTFLLPSEY